MRQELAAAGAEGLQLVAVSERWTRQLERRQDRERPAAGRGTSTTSRQATCSGRCGKPAAAVRHELSEEWGERIQG